MDQNNSKKGFTLVELVLSVTLLSVVLVFMMAMLVDLKDKEKSSGADAKLLINQAIISKTVNTDIITYGIDSISACAAMNCFIFSYSNGEEKTLKLMSDNQTLFYGNDRTTEFIRTLPEGRKYSSIHYYIYANLEIVRISLNKVYKNEDYDVEIYNYMGNKTTSTGGYAAAGLVMHLDGINNAATGKHSPTSPLWMDLTGSGNNGTLSNFPTVSTATSGWIENGIVLDGNDDGIYIGDGLKDLFKSSATVEFTFSKSELSNRDVLFSTCTSTNSTCNMVELTENNKLKVQINGTAFTFTTDNEVVSNSDIMTIALVFDKNTGIVTVYLDGQKGQTVSSTAIISNTNEMHDLYIGRDYTGGTSSFKGTLYSFRAYSYALSSTKLYTNANIDKTRFIKQWMFTTPTDTFVAQTFTPNLSGLYKFELWGARGGNFGDYKGGEGAYTSGIIELSIGDNIFMYIGSQGSDSANSGGANGGGLLTSGQEAFGRVGGGATDLRVINGEWTDATSINSRIMVAAGGGGANHRGEGYGDGDGGAGGGLTGYDGETINFTNGYGHQKGTGGTQIEGGHQISYAGTTLAEGDILRGGFGYSTSAGQSGQGGGYYTGADAGHGGAGGGSSYISGHTGCVAIRAEYDPTPLEGCTEGNTIRNCSIHYSKKQFNETKMIDGTGYAWTNQKDTLELMPNPLGGYYSAGKGNNTNGYVRITYIGQSS